MIHSPRLVEGNYLQRSSLISIPNGTILRNSAHGNIITVSFQNIERLEPTLGPRLGRHADVKYRRREAVEQRDTGLGKYVIDIEEA